MRLLRNLLRVYSYVYEALLCLMGLLLSAFGMASRNLDVQVGWLPWTGPGSLRAVLSASIAGLICVGLAAFGVARLLLWLFSGAVVYIMARGMFVNTQYSFTGADDARNALMVLVGAFLAFIGAFPMTPKRTRRG